MWSHEQLATLGRPRYMSPAQHLGGATSFALPGTPKKNPINCSFTKYLWQNSPISSADVHEALTNSKVGPPDESRRNTFFFLSTNLPAIPTSGIIWRRRPLIVKVVQKSIITSSSFERRSIFYRTSSNRHRASSRDFPLLNKHFAH